MHYIKAKGILSSHNGMNLYRGCTHGCIYCDSRSVCYHMEHAFEDIEVKENAIELLEDKLKRKRQKCMLATGSMTDPYIPLENQLQYVRQALLLAEKYEFGFTLMTKSSLVLRDIDILKRINEKTKCVVQMTMTTYDEELCQKLEPHVSTTKERFETLKKLNEAGIPTIVWLCPILPFINDTKENLYGILKYCIEAKVYGIIHFGMGVTLREGNREYFYSQLDRLFPGMKDKYIRTFGTQYVNTSPHEKELNQLLHNVCHKHHIICDNDQLFAYLKTFESKQDAVQLSLFDDFL